MTGVYTKLKKIPLLRKMYKSLHAKYIRHLSPLSFSSVVPMLFIKRVNNEREVELTEFESIDIKCDFKENVPPFIFSTDQGIFYYNDHQLLRLIGDSFFGITWVNDTLYLLTKRLTDAQENSYLFSVIKEANSIKMKKILEISRFFTVHSMDYYKGKLYIMLTNINGILVFDPKMNTFFVSKLDNKRVFRSGPNHLTHYHHYNSVFINDDYIWLMAHNDTYRTNRESEIHRFRLKDILSRRQRLSPDLIIPTKGKCGHNIFYFNSDLYWCDSDARTCMKNNTAIAKLKIKNMWSRGVDWDGDYFIVGGSSFNKNKKERFGSNSCIEVWKSTSKSKLENIGIIYLPNIGGIHDLRFIRNGRSLSNENENALQWLHEIKN